MVTWRKAKAKDAIQPRTLGRSKLRRGRQRSLLRKPALDALEKRELLTVTPLDGVQQEVSLTPDPTSRFDTRTSNSIAVDNDGDFVITYVRQELVQNQVTGQFLLDTNIYARYFTDEMQRITLPGSAVGGDFSIIFRGDKVVQRLTITGDALPPFSGQFIGGPFGGGQPPVVDPGVVPPPSVQRLAGTYVVGFDADGDGTISNQEQVTVQYGSGAALESALNGLGGAAVGITVDELAPGELIINIPPETDDLGQFRQVAFIDDSGLTGGFLPGGRIETVRVPITLTDPLFTNAPIRLFNDPDPNRVAEVTAQLIQLSFANRGLDVDGDGFFDSVTTEVTGRYNASLDSYEFDIRFLEKWGKRDIPELIIDNVNDADGNSLGGSDGSTEILVETLKESTPEFRVNEDEIADPITGAPNTTIQGAPSVAMDADGDFIIVWGSEVPDSVNFGSQEDIFARRYNSLGQPVAGQFRVNDFTTNRQFNPSVDVDTEGNFVIIWVDEGQDVSFFNNVRARLYDSEGQARAGSFLVSEEIAQTEFDPDVAMSPDGHFTIVWANSFNAWHILAKVYQPDGTLLLDYSPDVFQAGMPGNPTLDMDFIDEVPFGTNPTDDINQDPVVGMDSGNRFVIAWNTSLDPEPAGTGQLTLPDAPRSIGIRAKQYNAVGEVILQQDDTPIRVNTSNIDVGAVPEIGLDQFEPTIAVDDDGDFVVGWEGFGFDLDGDINQIFSTGFTPVSPSVPPNPDDGRLGVLPPDADSQVRNSILNAYNSFSTAESQRVTLFQGADAPSGTFNLVWGNTTSPNIDYLVYEQQTINIVVAQELQQDGLSGNFTINFGNVFDTFTVISPNPNANPPPPPNTPPLEVQIQTAIQAFMDGPAQGIQVPGLPAGVIPEATVTVTPLSDANMDGIPDEFDVLIQFQGNGVFVDWPNITLIPGQQGQGGGGGGQQQMPIATAFTTSMGPVQGLIESYLESLLNRGDVDVTLVPQQLPGGGSSSVRDINGDGIVDLQFDITWGESARGIDFPPVVFAAGFDNAGNALNRYELQTLTISPPQPNAVGDYRLAFGSALFGPYTFTNAQDLVSRIQTDVRSIAGPGVLVSETALSGTDIDGDGVADIQIQIEYRGQVNLDVDQPPLRFLPDDNIVRVSLFEGRAGTVAVHGETEEIVKGGVDNSAIAVQRRSTEDFVGQFRGDPNGVYLSTFDADNQQSNPTDRPGVLVDEMVSTRRDGGNQQFVLFLSKEFAIPSILAVSGGATAQGFMGRTQITGSVTMNLTTFAGGMQSFSFEIPSRDNNPDWDRELITNVETGFESTGQFGTRATDDEFPFSVWVRLVPFQEIAARQGTPYEITINGREVLTQGNEKNPDFLGGFGLPVDLYVLEFTFINARHDRSSAAVSLTIDGPATAQSLVYELLEPPGGGGQQQQQDEPDYDDVLVLFGMTQERPADVGSEQKRVSVAMEPDGDFVVTWVDAGERLGADVLSYDPIAPLLNPDGAGSLFGVGYGYGYVYGYFTADPRPTSVMYRRYSESTDTAGPKVTEFALPSGSSLIKIPADGLVTEELEFLIVSFDEDMMTTGPNSVTNPANWALTESGRIVQGAISQIEYGMNKAWNLGLGPKTNKFEAVIRFDGNGPFPGTPALPNGDYVVTARNSLRDRSGNPLGRTGFQIQGANFTRQFTVSAFQSNEFRVNQGKNAVPVVDGNLVSPQSVAADHDGDYTTVWQADSGGIVASIFQARTPGQLPQKVRDIQVTTSPSAQYAAVARDGDGDFVVTWMEYDFLSNWDIYARRYNAVGDPLGPEFLVSAADVDEPGAPPAGRPFAQTYPSVGMDVDGDFVIAWQSLGEEEDEFGYGVYAQRYDSLGFPLGGSGEQQSIQFFNSPRGGTFALEFEGFVTDPIVFERSLAQTALNVEIALEALPNVTDVEVTALGGGRLLVEFVGPEGQRDVDVMLPVDVSLTPAGVVQVDVVRNGFNGQFLVSNTVDGDQTDASVAMSDAGEFVIAWASTGQDSDAEFESNIYARRFASNEIAVPDRQTSVLSAREYLLSDESKIMPLLVSADNPVNHLTNPGSATGFDGVARMDLDGALCTGTLLPTGIHVLTAAHCVDFNGDGTSDVNNPMVTFEVAGGAEVIAGTQIFVHPGWNNNMANGNDIAIVALQSAASSAVPRHDIYRQSDEIRQAFTIVGYGPAGQGVQQLPAGIKRFGQNQFDAGGEILEGVFFAPGTVTPGSQLLFDFDNGQVANDFFGTLFNLPDLGLGNALEVMAGPGDSGGPSFINNQIAGVSSYIGTFATPPDVDDMLNSSFGEFTSVTRVSTYASWIDEILTGSGFSGGPLGSEFIVNANVLDPQGNVLVDNESGVQRQPEVAMDADGDFVIAWTSYGHDGGGSGYGGGYSGLDGVFARRFASSGAASSNPFLVNTTVDRNQQAPSISMDANGDFAIAWESFQDRSGGSAEPNSYGIYAQRYVRTQLLGRSPFYGPNGEVGGEVPVNVTKPGDQRFPSVALDNEGDLIVQWVGPDGQGGTGVFQSFNRAEFDEAGPMVTDVLVPVAGNGFQRVTNNTAITPLEGDGAVNRFVVIFGEDVVSDSSGAFSSVTNPNNWQLMVGGRLEPGSIVNVQYGLNLRASQGGDPSDKFEAIVTLDGDPATPGIQPLPRGRYTLIARDRIEDLEDNRLDGDRNGIPGNDFRLTFDVGGRGGVGGPLPDPPGPPREDPDDPTIPTDDSPIHTPTAIIDESSPAVAMNEAGDYVAVWVSADRILGRLFNNIGSPIGSEFQIFSQAAPGAIQSAPDVAMDGTGGFVVVWEENDNSNRDDRRGIWARQFDFTGVAIDDPFLVNVFTANPQTEPSVAMDLGGDFVVTWTSFGQDGDRDGVFARRFNSFGDALTGEIQVNSRTAERQSSSDVTMDGDGDFVVVWNSFGQDGSEWGVYGQRFDGDGARLGGEFRVNDTTADKQRFPKVAMDNDGDFVVTWQSFGGVGAEYDVFAKRFNAAGGAVGGEFRVNSTTAAWQQSPDVAMSDDGDFYFTWTSRNQDGDKDGIFAKLFNADGSNFVDRISGSVLGEFRVNRTTDGNQFDPAIAADQDGDLVVVWTGEALTFGLSQTEIFGRYMLVNEPAESTIDQGTGSGTGGSTGGSSGGGGGGGGSGGGSGGGGSGGGAGSWYNTTSPLDVNNDGSISPIDALLVINRINDGGPGQLGTPPAAGTIGHHFVDTNNDGSLSALDALLVINHINAQSAIASASAPGAQAAAIGISHDLALASSAAVLDESDLSELAADQATALRNSGGAELLLADHPAFLAMKGHDLREAVSAKASALTTSTVSDDSWELYAELDDLA